MLGGDRVYGVVLCVNRHLYQGNCIRLREGHIDHDLLRVWRLLRDRPRPGDIVRMAAVTSHPHKRLIRLHVENSVRSIRRPW